MHKLVIVDDEYLVRTGIRETIDWSAYGIEVVGEAVNGRDGFELIRQTRPDLVITDIKMPLMNGVDLIKKLRAEGFEGEIVVLSGYKDFEYAKETFENGIFSYVVKPIDNAELVEVVLKALEKLEQKIRDRKLNDRVLNELPALQNEFMKRILTSNAFVGSDLAREINLHDLQIPASGLLALIVLDEEYRTKTADLARFYTSFAKELSRNSLIHSLYDFGESVAIFIKTDSVGTIEKMLKECFVRFEQESLTALTAAVWAYESPEYIKKAYDECQRLIQSKLLFHLNTVERESDDQTSYRHRQNIIAVYHLIAAEYATGLTVRSAAQALDVSESYLMHLLKDNLGKTFNEILTGYRIGIAKRLLLRGRYRINEVADKVGYSDVKYFSQVFKKLVGVTPSDYRGHDIG